MFLVKRYVYTPKYQRMEPENDGLVQMFFPFFSYSNGVIARFHATLPGYLVAPPLPGC